MLFLIKEKRYDYIELQNFLSKYIIFQSPRSVYGFIKCVNQSEKKYIRENIDNN